MVKSMLLYIIIFIAKVIENAVGTLRLIVVSNGKKVLGAILQGIIAIIWICVTGVVVTNIMEDPFKIVAFSLGSIVGSYLGSILEEKIALGNNLLMIITEQRNEVTLTNKIREQDYAVTVVDAKGKDTDKSILLVFLPRKKIHVITKLTKQIDNNSLILSENAFNILGGYIKKR